MKTFSDFGITNLQGAGAEQRTTCPQCSSSRRNKRAPCLSVNIDKGCWLCHHCGWRGGLEKGVEDRSNPHLWKPKEWVKPTYLEKAPDVEMLEWFKTRGIPEAIIRRNRISPSIEYMPQQEKDVPVIQFPFLRSGEIINIKCRTYDKNFRMVAGAQRVFYGLDDIEGLVYIVEGELDKLAVEAAGFKNCISVPDGAPPPTATNYDSKFDFLENCRSELAQVSTFVLAVDNDKPGQILESELARRLGKEKCLHVILPTDCKDANDVLLKHGSEILRECLLNAVPFPVEGTIEVEGMKDKLLNFYRDGREAGTHPGWEYLAPLYTVKEGQMTIVTGMPNSGKSEWLDALLVNLAVGHGWNFAMYSPENQPVEEHVAKLCEKYIGKPAFPSPTQRMNETEFEHGIDWVGEHFTFLSPEEDALRLDSVLEMAKQLVFIKGVRGLVIDPWNELDHQRPSNLSETEYISQALTKIRYFARKHGVHVWVVAHPTKLEKDAKGCYPVVRPYDIAGSAHWFNKADNCLSIWRNLQAPKEPVQVHVQKVRFKSMGRTGKVLFDYDIATGRYTESKDQ